MFKINGIARNPIRLFSPLLCVLLMSTMASAYTIVMRSGRHLDTPDRFTISDGMLTYEAAPGLNVTFPVAGVDITATERVNRESPGSFLRHAAAERASSQTPTTPERKRATTVITNQTLAPYERVRVASEAASEKRRQELGLPSLEESRRQAARDQAALDEFIAKKKQETANNELLERQAEMQSQMAAMLAWLSVAQQQQGQGFWPGGFVSGDIGAFGTGFPFGVVNRGFGFGLRGGSPCGFNASVPCLIGHPFSQFNPAGLPLRRSVLVAPGTVRRGMVVHGRHR